MARALTAGELTYLRSKQASFLWLDVDDPPVIFACQVSQSFTTLDRVIEVIYDNVTAGAYGDVLEGMTILIGSTPGDDDIGQCRIRKAAISTKLFLGEHADITWANDLYLTVIDEFGIWERRPRGDSMDYEIAYSNQHTNFSPIVNAGPARRVAQLTGAYVDLQYDLTGSWVIGSSLASYSCSAPGSILITGGTTATPTIRYDTAGRYRIAFTITAANGKSTTVYRTVRIWSDAAPLINAFTLSDCRGSYHEGGWEFSVTVLGEDASLASIRARVMVSLAAQDYYNGDEISIGPVAGFENIIAIGWIDGASIEYDPHGGSVSFTVKGPHFWMDQEEGEGIQLTNVGAEAANWNELNGLTIDKAVYHLVYWRSTVAAMMDVYKSDDTRAAPELAYIQSSLWLKLGYCAEKILARPCCDRYGRLFVEIDPQLTTPGSRSGPSVMTLQKGDWLESGLIIIENQVEPNDAVILASLHVTQNGSPPITLYSLSPGHDPKRFGQPMILEQLLAASQAQSNEMAGLILGNKNRSLDFEINLAMNNRGADICPAQYMTLAIAVADTFRGIAYSGQSVVREAEFTQDKKGFLLTKWKVEQESYPENSVNGDIPNSTGGFDELPDLPPLPPLPKIPALPVIPGVETNSHPRIILLVSSNFGVLYTENFDNATPQWKMMNGGLTQAQYQDIWDVAVSPSGAVAVMFGKNTGGNCRYIAIAPSIGSPFEIVFDANTDVPGTYAANGILALGVNKNKSEEFGIIAGGSNNPIDASGYLFLGSRTGFIQKVWNAEFNIAHFGGLSYGYGKWIVTHSKVDIFGTARISRINATGTTVEYQANTGGSDGNDQTHRRADSADRLILYSILGDDLVFYNQGVNNFSIPTATFEVRRNRNRIAVAGSPSGNYLMGAHSSSLTPKRSSDGGSSWGVVGTLSTGRDVWENCGNNMIFIAGAGDIQLTMDWGDSWINKQGNLITLAPLIDITHIEFMSF